MVTVFQDIHVPRRSTIRGPKGDDDRVSDVDICRGIFPDFPLPADREILVPKRCDTIGCRRSISLYNHLLHEMYSPQQQRRKRPIEDSQQVLHDNQRHPVPCHLSSQGISRNHSPNLNDPIIPVSSSNNGPSLRTPSISLMISRAATTDRSNSQGTSSSSSSPNVVPSVDSSQSGIPSSASLSLLISRASRIPAPTTVTVDEDFALQDSQTSMDFSIAMVTTSGESSEQEKCTNDTGGNSLGAILNASASTIWHSNSLAFVANEDAISELMDENEDESIAEEGEEHSSVDDIGDSSDSEIQEFPDGRLFEGNYDAAANCGVGRMIYPDGSAYEGPWLDGLRHGKGRCLFQDGSMYEGDFYRGHYQGHGIVVWNDGGYYEGEWFESEIHGRGVEVLPDGSVRYDGIWENGEPVGL